MNICKCIIVPYCNRQHRRQATCACLAESNCCCCRESTRWYGGTYKICDSVSTCEEERTKEEGGELSNLLGTFSLLDGTSPGIDELRDIASSASQELSGLTEFEWKSGRMIENILPLPRPSD